MNIFNELSFLFEQMDMSSEIQSALNQRLFDTGFEGVQVDEVQVDPDGDILVAFVDEDGDELDVLFNIDPEEGAEAIILDDGEGELPDDEREFEVDMIDLDALDPKTIKLESGAETLDLINNKWLNSSFFETLLTGSDLLDNEATGLNAADTIEERTAIVIRGGKKVKVALKRRKRKKRLTAKQRAGIKKGVRSRRAKKGQIARKRKKSLKLRKRLKLKRKDNKRFKVGR